MRALAASHMADHVVLSEESGQQLFNTLVDYGLPLPITKNIERIREVYRSAKPRISNLVTGTLSRKHELLIDIPVIQNGRVIYVLTSVLNSDGLRSILVDQQFPKEWVANIFDGEGSVVARSRDYEKFVGTKVSSRLLRQLAERNSGVYENVNLDGITTVAAFLCSADTGFGVTIGVPKNLLLKEAAGALPATAISIAVFALLVAWHFSASLKARRESETQLKQFIKHAPVALAMFDRNMKYMAASQRWVDSYRLADTEFADSSAHGHAAPLMPEYWQEAHRRGLRGEATANEEDLVPSGRWLRWEARPWETPGGSLGGIIIYAEDISERKRATVELDHYRHNLEQLVNNQTHELEMAKQAAEAANSAKTTFLTNMTACVNRVVASGQAAA